MSTTTFVKLNSKNISKYIDSIADAELNYPEKLRTSIQDYTEIINEKDSVCLALFQDNEFAGCILGSNDYENNIVEGFNLTNSIYIYNIIVLPKFQGKGYGYELMNKFIEESNKLKYNFVCGNFRLNGSYALAKKFNKVYEKITPNWEDSGEDFVFCIIKI